MVIYWIIWFYLCVCNLITTYRNNLTKIFFIFTILFLFLFIGFRYQIGGDWYNYLYFYNDLKNESLVNTVLSGDLAYNFLSYLGHKFNFEDTLFVNATCALVVIICLMKFALNNKYFWLVLLVYYPYHLLVVSMGYTRQSVAIALSLLAFNYLINKKVFYFILFIIFSAMFHKTAIVLLFFAPLIFFSYFNIPRYVYTLYIIFTLLIITGILYYFTLLESSVYVRGNEEMTSKGFFFRWIYHIIPLIIFFRYKKYYTLDYSYRILSFFALLIIYFLFLGFGFSTLADRFNLYLIFFDLFVLLKAFNFLNFNKRTVLVLSLILFYTLSMYLWFFYGEWATKAWIPYQNYITNFLINKVF